MSSAWPGASGEILDYSNQVATQEEKICFLQKDEVGQAGQSRDLVSKGEIAEQSSHTNQCSEICHPRKTLEA